MKKLAEKMQTSWPPAARLWIAVGAVAGAAAVAMDAIAAHALPQRLDAQSLAAVQSAIQLQAWHALALLFTGLFIPQAGKQAATLAWLAGAGFALGMLLFCGAIYLHHFAGIRLGPAAPTGGILLIIAWLLLAAAAVS